MITPNESQHSVNVNVFPSVSANLYCSPAKMAAIAASQSHCTRPSSVPGCFAHREGFNVSTKSHLSPVNANQLSPYFTASPVCQLPLSPAINTCNEYYLSDLKDSSEDNETSHKSCVPVISPQSSVVASNSGREGSIPSPVHSISPQSHNSPVSSSNSPVVTTPSVLVENQRHNSPDHNSKSDQLVIDFPRVCTKSDGGFCLNLPMDVVLPRSRGQDTWNYYQHLLDVIVTVINRSGQLLYHEKHLLTQHDLRMNDEDFQTCCNTWSDNVLDIDLAVWEKYSSKTLSEASRWCRARNALLHPEDENVVSTTGGCSSSSNAGDSVSVSYENSLKRYLLESSIYRIKLGEKWFYMHTFSLPVYRITDSLGFGELPVFEPLVAHYHNLLSECDQISDLTGQNASVCFKKAVAQSSIPIDINSMTYSSLYTSKMISRSFKGTKSISPVMNMSDTDENSRMVEVSNSSRNPSLSSDNCCSHDNSADPSIQGQKLVNNSSPSPTSSSSTTHVIPHHHHVHFTHHHHHPSHPSPNQIHDTTINNVLPIHQHLHHHHYVRHHHPTSINHLSNIPHNSPQSELILHVPCQNSIQEKSTGSFDIAHSQICEQRKIQVDNAEWNTGLYDNDSSNYNAIPCQSTTTNPQCLTLLDPKHHHHHHHHHHHSLIHTNQHSHNVCHPHCHQNDKSTITEFVPAASSSSCGKPGSPVVLKSNLPSQSECLPSIDSTGVQYPNLNVVGTSCDNKSMLLNVSSGLSETTNKSLSSCDKRHSCVSAVKHHYKNGDIINLDSSINESNTNSSVLPESNVFRENEDTDGNLFSERLYRKSTDIETTDQQMSTHYSESVLQQRPLNKDQYDKRILMLQHLLPDEAIQEIRQIWQEMNINKKSDTDNLIASSSQLSISTTTATSISPNQSPPHNASNLREHFARRVRQVVRQYLGPKAFITDSLTDSQSTIDSQVMLLQSDKYQQLTSVSNCNETHREISSPILSAATGGENDVPTPLTISATFDATTVISATNTIATCMSSEMPTLSCSVNHTKISSTDGVISFQPVFSQSHDQINPTESSLDVGCGTTQTPLATATTTTSSTTVVADVVENDTDMVTDKISSPCITMNKSSPACSKGNDSRFVEVGYNESTDACELSRISNSSQCCMLEWLLSEEADLCILPPSLCQSKTGDKLQQKISGISPTSSSFSSSSSSSYNQPVSPVTPCGITSMHIQTFPYNSPITEMACSPSSTPQQKTNTDVQINRQLMSVPRTSLVTTTTSPSIIAVAAAATTTTATATTTTIATLSNCTTIPSCVEVRSSPQPRTDSLLVRLLHPTKNHSLGISDISTYDGGPLTKPLASPTTLLPRSIVVCQSITDKTDLTCLNITNSTTTTTDTSVRQLNNRKPECRLIAASLDNLSDKQLTTLNNNKRCRSGPATTITQSISPPVNNSYNILSLGSGNKRTRHASQFEELTSSRKISGTLDYKPNSDIIPSPPFTSLTQLLMQDFPSITDIISNSPTPIDHPPKYTTAYEQNNNVNKSMKSVLNETNYDILTSNSTLSVDKEKVINVNNLHNNNNNNKSFLPQIHPLNVSNEKYPSNQNVHMSSNCATTTTAAATTTTTSITTATSSSSTTITTSSGKHIPLSDRNNMEVSSILSSWSTSVPSTVKSSIESKDTFPVRGTKASNINSGGSVPVQSSLCRLLLDAQLEPEEISDAVANAQVSEISYCHSTESKEQRFGTSLKDDMRFTSFADSSHSCDEQLRISGSTINTSSCQSVTPYSIAPVEWNDDDLQQLIHEATVNSDDKVLEKNPCTSSPSSLLLLPPKRHPSASSKEIAEEVEILCEILRRDELERNHPKPESSYNPCDTTNSTSYISESPCSKRSRFSSSTSISEHQTLDGDNVINDGELTYRNEVNWQNDAKAVARICEQLQQGLVSDKSTYTTLNTTTDFSSYSIISNNNTSTSCNNLLECSISRNDEKIISKHSPLDNNSALVTTRTIWSGYSPQPSNTVQRNAVGGSSASINKAAVAAALASQQAAASQRNQLMNQRLLAEQRKRLIQHQLYNQVAVYSLNSRQHIPTYEYCNPDTVTAVDTSHQGNPFIINESMMDGGEGGGGVEMLLHSNTITATTTTCSTPHPLLHIIPSKSLRKKTLCSNGIQNNNLNILNLNATTVHSSNSASISTTSKLTGFYPPHQHHNHRPEDLSKFLKEVGPNVRVQLSCTIPTSDRQQSNYMNKIPHVYPTSNNSIITTKMKQSSKQLTTTSIFPNSQMFIQSGNPTNKIHFPVATVYSNPSTLIVATTSSVSSVNNSSRLVKAELRQALVGRQVIYQNNNNNPGDNHRGFHCSQVSRQFSDPIPMNIYETYSSTEGGVDHFSTSSLSSLPCTSRISSNHQVVHNPHITYSLCPAQNSNSSVNCQQWSPTTSQSISVHQVPLNSDNMSSLSSNNAYPPQSVHLVHGGGSGYHSQGFSSSNEIEKKNKTDTYDFLNHNNSSLCFNTLNHSNIYRLTPSSLSPISVSANTSPSSSTTSQTGLLKSPICQSTEFAYTSCESSLMTVNPNNYPYEGNASLECHPSCLTMINGGVSDNSASSALHNYVTTTTTISNNNNPLTGSRSFTTLSSSVIPHEDNTVHLESMLQLDFRQQQQQEENLLPDDLINDVFDLENMIATKHHHHHQQSEQHYHESLTSNELNFLTNPPLHPPQMTTMTAMTCNLKALSSSSSSPSSISNSITNQCIVTR